MLPCRLWVDKIVYLQNQLKPFVFNTIQHSLCSQKPYCTFSRKHSKQNYIGMASSILRETLIFFFFHHLVVVFGEFGKFSQELVAIGALISLFRTVRNRVSGKSIVSSILHSFKKICGSTF